MYCSCVSKRWFSIGLIWLYGSSKRTEFTFCRGREIVAWGGAVFLDVFLLLKYFACDPCLWFFWRIFSLNDFLWMYNGPLKGKLSSVTSCCIENSFTPLLLIPHPIQYYFRYGIDEVLGIWNDMGWYFWLLFLCCHCWILFLCWCWWLVFLWVCWRWFGPLWCWNVFPKFRLKMGSIIEWYGVMYISAVYRVSNTPSIVGVSVMESCFICGRCSKFL